MSEIAEKKYILTDETVNHGGVILHRIKAIKDFDEIKAGDLGGFIEKESNLSHTGPAWVFDNAMVFGNAMVFEDAQVFGNAMVYDNAKIFQGAIVYENAQVYGNALIYCEADISGNAHIRGDACINGAHIDGNAYICGDALIRKYSDYIVFKNWWDPGEDFTWTRSNNQWQNSRFHYTGEELIKHGYNNSEKSGREYTRVVQYVESILKDENIC